MKILVDDLQGAEIAQFLQQHIADMRATSPPESKHALDLDGLRVPDITFWSAYDDGKLVACGALKELSSQHGEIKSMRVSAATRGTGIGSKMLTHIITTAKSRGYKTLQLETGSMAFFEAARNLYLKHGFQFCGPFGSYQDDPHSCFMELQLV